MHFIISFSNNTVGTFPQTDLTLEKAARQMVERCATVGLTGSLIDNRSHKVVGRVIYRDGGYHFDLPKPDNVEILFYDAKGRVVDNEAKAYINEHYAGEAVRMHMGRSDAHTVAVAGRMCFTQHQADNRIRAHFEGRLS